MANVCVLVSWSGVIPGREKVAGETFGSFANYLGGLHKEGRVESYEPVLLTPNGSGINGYFLLRGEAQKLAEVRATEAWREQISRANLYVQDLCVAEGFIGEGINDAMQRFQKLAQSL